MISLSFLLFPTIPMSYLSGFRGSEESQARRPPVFSKKTRFFERTFYRPFFNGADLFGYSLARTHAPRVYAEIRIAGVSPAGWAGKMPALQVILLQTPRRKSSFSPRFSRIGDFFQRIHGVFSRQFSAFVKTDLVRGAFFAGKTALFRATYCRSVPLGVSGE
jgi:hypothetical protein